MAKAIQIYDPAMCCSSGVCGTSVDPALVRFAADLDWLKAQGVQVERYNLALQPGAFVASPVVKRALDESGPDCLPLVVCDGAIASRKAFPERAALAALAGVPFAPAARPAGRRLGVVSKAEPSSECCSDGSSSGACC